jgi:glycine/D-amino acid oxidase-like deaminating enzyme
MSERLSIGIVGAGIAGLSTALALAARGHDVTVFEQGPVPNPLGSSVDRHRLIRFPYGDAEGYTRMVGEAFSAWDRTWAALGARHYFETGTLVHAFRDGDWADQSAKVMDRLGIAYDRLDPAEVARRYPHILPEGLAGALHLPSGGVLLADRIVADLAEHLQRIGVAIDAWCQVAWIDPERARVRFASGAVRGFDAVVAAAGPWAARLFPGLAPRLKPVRQVVAYLEPPRGLEAAWASSPMILDIDGADGHYAVPPVAGTGLKIGDHQVTGPASDPDAARIAAEDEGRAVIAGTRRRLARFDEYRVAEAKTCFYTMTPDERFVAEKVGRMVLVSACSGHGFKFGALMGERVAAAVAGEIDGPALAAWAAGETA